MEKHAVKRSLRVSFWDGVFAVCMTGFTQDYFTPYALALGAHASHIGALTAVPNVTGSLSQLASADFTEKVGSRKKIICSFVFLQAAMLVPIILVPYLWKGWAPAALIVFVTLFTSFNSFATPVWLSLMSDYLPYKKRGAYFGWRNKILGLVGIVCAFAAGAVLHMNRRNALAGFAVIFGLACLCRFASGAFLTRMYEPRQHYRPDSYFSLFDFIRRARESNFARFVFFDAMLKFSVYVASPFFSVFMLRELKFDYLVYTIVVTTVSVATIATIERWGRVADRIGNVKVLRLTSLIIASLPFWWLLGQHPAYLAFAQVVSGIAWAGFNLCAINFIYDAVTPQKRTRCIAYFSLFDGVAVFAGSLVGGFLASRLPVLLGWRLLTLFAISGSLRLLVALTVPRRIREVRPVEKMSTKDLIARVLGLKPVVD